MTRLARPLIRLVLPASLLFSMAACTPGAATNGADGGGDAGGDASPPAALQVIGREPAENATGVAVSSVVRVTFDQPVAVGGLGSGCSALFAVSADGFTTCVDVTFSASGATLTAAPTSPLAYATVYAARVQAGLAAMNGARLESAVTWSFTTAAPPDTTAPTATLMPPSPGVIRQDTPIVVQFSESIDVSSFVAGGTLGAAVTGATWSRTSVADDTVTLSGVWPAGSAATLTVDAADLAANPMVTLAAIYDVISVPLVVSALPASGATLNAASVVTVEFSKPMNQSSLMLSGTLAASAMAAWPNATTVQLSPLAVWPNSASPSDTKTLTINADDQDGESLTPYLLTYLVDSVLPTVTSTFPAANATMGPGQSVVFRFSESMKTASVPALSGTLAPSVSGLAWSQTTLPDDTLTVSTAAWPNGASGTLIVPAAASDLAGNLLGGAGYTLTLDVDAQGPSLTLTSGPAGGSTTTTTSYTIDVNSAALDAATYSYTLTGPTPSSASGVSLATDITLSGLASGSYTLTVTGLDQVGNSGVATVVSFTVDTQGPSVSLVNGPSNGSTTATTSYTIDVGSGAGDAASYSYSLTGPVTSSGNAIAFSTDISLPSLTSGSYTLTVTGKDTLGNSGTPTVVMFTVDVSGPVVTLSGAPSNNSTSSTTSYTIDVSSAAMDAASYSYTLTGPSPSSASTIAFSTDISLSGLSGGAYTLTVTGKDTLGNNGTPTVVNFTVDLAGPTISASPTSGSIIDWATPIVITANESLDATASVHVVSGTMTTAITFTKDVSGVTLTLTPNPHWVSDSSKTLSIVAKDVYGNASATLDLTYHVRDGGVYVRTNGSNANPGTRSQPFLTVAHGLTTVGSAYPAAANAEVRVAAGSYNEAVTIPAGVKLLGGYHASDWTITPSRTTYVTSLRDQSTPAAADLATVTMSDGSRIERFHLDSSMNATGRCISVQARVATTNPIVIADNDIQSNDCPTVGAYSIVLTKGTVQLSGNTIRSGNKPAPSFPGSRAVYAVPDSATPLNLSISGDDIASGDAANGVSRTIEFSGAALTMLNATVVAGQGNNPWAISVASTQNSLIEGCTVYGGKAQSSSAAVGIIASPTGGTLKILRNLIHGGDSVISSGTPNGISVTSGDVLVANNLITGGGTPGVLAGTARAVILGSNAKLYNNTIHAGFRDFSVAVQVGSNNLARLENNIFFYKGGAPTVSGFVGLVWEPNASNNPLTLKNNVFFNADSVANVFGYLDYDLPNGNCTSNTIYDCTPLNATNLNTEAETNDSADATSADGNLVANPLFSSIDGGDAIFTFFATGAFTFANDWSLQASSTVKASGIDGAASYGFTTDFLGLPRTGNGTTGWSPGAFERD